MTDTVLVTGATGTVGRALVSELVSRGMRVRAGARHPPRAGTLATGAEYVHLDLGVPRSLDNALEGVARVFLLTPLEESMVGRAERMVARAMAHGVRHIVRLSALGAGSARPNALGRVHRAVEESIESCGAAWTFLRPNGFMQNFVTQCAAGIRERNAFYIPQADGRVSMVDARDIAAVAAEVLASDDHFGRSYELTGPEALSNNQAANLLSEAVGREIRYVETEPEEARRAMRAAGMPSWIAGVIMELYAMSAANEASEISGALETVLARQPRTFARFARDYAGHFRCSQG